MVTAQYVRTHRVNFYDYDGTVLKTEFVLPDMPATAPSTPIREGYVFDGWDVSFTTVTTDLSVNAIYRVATYTVTFVNPSGAVLLTTEGVKHGQYAEPPAVSDAYFDWNALRAYRFKEWSATTDQVTEDMVVHAIYEEEVKEPVLVARNAEITRGSENVLITLFLCPGSVFYGLSLDVRFDPALTLGGQPTVVVRETFGKAEEDKGAADYTSSLNANGNYEFRWTNGEGVDPAKFSGPVTILTFDLHLDEFQATGLYTLDILESSYLITDTFQKVTPVLIDGVVTVK